MPATIEVSPPARFLFLGRPDLLHCLHPRRAMPGVTLTFSP